MIETPRLEEKRGEARTFGSADTDGARHAEVLADARKSACFSRSGPLLFGVRSNANTRLFVQQRGPRSKTVKRALWGTCEHAQVVQVRPNTRLAIREAARGH